MASKATLQVVINRLLADIGALEEKADRNPELSRACNAEADRLALELAAARAELRMSN
jgi:hypothetical protein